MHLDWACHLQGLYSCNVKVFCQYHINKGTSCILIERVISRAFTAVTWRFLSVHRSAWGRAEVSLSAQEMILLFQHCSNHRCRADRLKLCWLGLGVFGHPVCFCWLCGELLGERCLVSVQGAAWYTLFIAADSKEKPVIAVENKGQKIIHFNAENWCRVYFETFWLVVGRYRR